MPLLDVFFTMMWFFLWSLWFFLLFRVIMDIFRSRDLGGWGKAGWAGLRDRPAVPGRAGVPTSRAATR